MNLIFSADENWGIGKGNQLLFRVSPDMQHFKEKTTGGVVIMGRKTLDSLPGGMPLENRVNVVLTRDPDGIRPEIRDRLIACVDLAALACVLQNRKAKPDATWVVGGAEIIELLEPYCREAYVTRFLSADKDADRRVKNLDAAEGWEIAETGELQEWDGLRFRFDRYRNNNVKEFQP